MKLQAINLTTKSWGIKAILKLVAAIVILLIFFKCLIDVDRSYDTWVYHLPFAARIWDIIPADIYALENHEEARFDGFPLFAEFLQGFFWFIFQHIQAANLVSFLSLVLYFCFLKVNFKVPFYLSVLALLAIPLVQTHSTTCYVDLLGNICISILILMTYLLFIKKDYSLLHLVTILIAAACAANTKPQLVPLVFLILCFILFRVVSLRLWKIHEVRGSLVVSRRGLSDNRKKRSQWLRTALPTVFLAALLIFATPIKNVVLYGNPFYPVRIEIAGRVLNHKVGLYSASPDYLKDASRPQRWIYSILEIKSAPWSVDQWSTDPSRNRMGGFFGAYVVFNLLLLGYLFWCDRSRETSVAVILVAIMSAVAASIPQSHELRYYMYWMISLVSLNLYLVSRLERSRRKLKLMGTKSLGVICAFALTFVMIQTKAVSVIPTFSTMSVYIQEKVNPEVLRQIEPGDRACLVGMQPHTFLYAAKFHPQLIAYSIKAAGAASECEGRKVIE